MFVVVGDERYDLGYVLDGQRRANVLDEEPGGLVDVGDAEGQIRTTLGPKPDNAALHSPCHMNTDNLYHYTDAAGLLGILGNPNAAPEIWMTQIQFMNDSAEWRHAFDLLCARIKRHLHHTHPAVKIVIEKYASHDCYSEPRFFVFSLSEQGDLLSQWRGYTPNGGYSLGFSRKSLEDLVGRHDFKLIKCVYTDLEKEGLIDNEIFAVLSELEGGTIHLDSEDVARQGHDGSLAYAVWNLLTSRVYQLAPYFKHSSFREEQEWRIVGAVPAGVGDPRERYRTRGNLIIPYCALPLPESKTEYPVKEIIYGPGVNRQLASHAISFVRSFESLASRPSSTTFRR